MLPLCCFVMGFSDIIVELFRWTFLLHQCFEFWYFSTGKGTEVRVRKEIRRVRYGYGWIQKILVRIYDGYEKNYKKSTENGTGTEKSPN